MQALGARKGLIAWSFTGSTPGPVQVLEGFYFMGLGWEDISSPFFKSSKMVRRKSPTGDVFINRVGTQVAKVEAMEPIEASKLPGYECKIADQDFVGPYAPVTASEIAYISLALKQRHGIALVQVIGICEQYAHLLNDESGAGVELVVDPVRWKVVANLMVNGRLQLVIVQLSEERLLTITCKGEVNTVASVIVPQVVDDTAFIGMLVELRGKMNSFGRSQFAKASDRIQKIKALVWAGKDKSPSAPGD